MNTMALPDGPSLPRFVQGGRAVVRRRPAQRRPLNRDHAAGAEISA